MSRIPQDIIDQVLSRVSVAELIGEYTRVERKGRSDQFMGLCPFHREKTPSFSISDSKGVYYCFGCQARGNAITFLKDHNGLSFPEAMELLAERAGIALPREDVDPAESRRRKRAEEAYLEVTHHALEFFESRLWGPDGAEAREYLDARGIDEDTARSFRLGYAPSGWSELVDHAATARISGAILERAGLAIARDRSGHYDRFRHRVMFPILDISGRCLAFSGRTLERDNPAKYINSPETRFYTKGRHLFGLHAARRAIRREDTVVLVEGNFDVVSLHAAGVETAVAPLGTALTEEQCHLIRRFSPKVILAFDGDRAGQQATDKALMMLLSQGITDIVTAGFTDGEDPDDYLQKHGAEALRARLDDARSMVEEKLHQLLLPALGSRDPAARREALLGVGELLSAMDDRMLAAATAQEVARRLDVDLDLIRRATRAAQRESTDPRPSPTPAREDGERTDAQEPSKPRQRLSSLELGLLRCLHESTERLAVIRNYHLFPLLTHRGLAKVLEEASEALIARGDVDIAAMLERSDDPTLAHAWYESVTGSRGFDLNTEDAAFESIVQELLIVGLQRKIKAVDRELAAHYRTHDLKDVAPLLHRREALVRSIDQLRGEIERS